MQYPIFCFYTFSHLKNLKEAVSIESLIKPQGQQHMFRSLNKVKPCSVKLVFGWVTKIIRIPSVVKTFCFLFSPSFSKVILRTGELPSLCNVVSSIYQLFVPHFAMAIFMCILIYSHYRTNKQWDTSFEFSSILLTVDLSKHLIKA